MKPKHSFVRGDGSRIQYLQGSTYPCPVCNQDNVYKERVLQVVARLDGTVCCECPYCGHDKRFKESEFDHLYKGAKYDEE